MPAKKDTPQGPTAIWLVSQIEEFLTLNEMENDGNYFGWLAIKDRTIVTRLRDGGDITTTKMDSIIAFMRSPVDNYKAESSRGLERIRALKPLIISKEL